MIRVDVEGYCQQCLDFYPDVKEPQIVQYADGGGTYERFYSDTVIMCKYRKRCAAIRRYLEQQMKKEVPNNE